jgi:hypothetical protein
MIEVWMPAKPPPPAVPSPLLPFFAWAIPPECQWWDLAGRDPHQPVARDLLKALELRH